MPPGVNGRALQEYLRRAEVALRSNNFSLAAALSSEAIERGLGHPNLLTLAVYHQINIQMYERGLELAVRARQLAPRSPDAMQAHGRVLAELGRHREAVEAFNAALRLAPGSPHILYFRAVAFENLQEIARAQSEYRRVTEIAPHPGALGKLAHYSALRGEVESARNYARSALQLEPGQSVATLALAQAELLEKKYDKAIAIAKTIGSSQVERIVNRAIARGIAADALDGQGRYRDAFAEYQESNALLRKYYADGYAALGAEAALARANRLCNYFNGCSPDHWKNTSSIEYESPVRAHVFLVGFPRSGTTLLENILSSHRDIESLEERDCLNLSIKDFLVPDGGLEALASIGSDDLERYRADYWREVRSHGIKLKSHAFVDKMPLYSVYLCLIAKLFPRAKVLFALRDPRDVVLSCFRRRFSMSAQMFELLTLEGAANYYASVMSLSQAYKLTLNQERLETRYEDLVASPDCETRRICDFIGLEYDETMQDFAMRAKGRMINTPSATQVTQGIYQGGRNQWRNYEDEMKPVLPTLAPWCARFGYGEE